MIATLLYAYFDSISVPTAKKSRLQSMMRHMSLSRSRDLWIALSSHPFLSSSQCKYARCLLPPPVSHICLPTFSYDVPAGQDRDGNRYGENYKGDFHSTLDLGTPVLMQLLPEYLAGIVHSAAICDRCIEPIHGEWFRCANCDADLCEDCEAIGVHDARHVFVVFKSSVDMFKFRWVALLAILFMDLLVLTISSLTFGSTNSRAVDLDNSQRRIGLLSHVVYAS
jgi:hypothetical protein